MPFDFDPPLRRHSLNDEEEIFELDTRFLMMTTIFAFLWLICLAVSAVTSSVDAFKGMLHRKLKPLKRLNTIRTDSVKSFDFLNDLTPPFCVETTIPGMGELPFHAPDVTHFCFLIHGHRGLSKDLRYMQTVMQKRAAVEKRRQWESASSSSSSDLGEDSSSSSSSSLSTSSEQPLIHDMVVHNAICNERKTTDGVRKGGDRLVEEMLDVIKTEMKKRHPEPTENEIHDVTLSVLGNSLGGLFGRYAVAKLLERHGVKESDEEGACWILAGKYRLHLNIFCTTATPHLGVSRHTYVRIPRSAEIGVAHAMGDTGKDLFRLNNLLHTMATCPTFLGPLANFRKRIAYANAYGTDFPVPACTAAFLSENSTYPHHFAEEFMVDDNDTGFVVATLHTPTEQNRDETSSTLPTNDSTEAVNNNNNNDSLPAPDNSDNKSGDHDDELHDMSMSLDKLGWKKVFIDVRREIPSVEIPSLRKRRSNSESRLVVDDNLLALKSKKIVQSKDVATVMALPTDNRLSLPLGHNMICAFSRSRISTFMNKGGRPIVDALAKELVEDIFKWNSGATSKDRGRIKKQ